MVADIPVRRLRQHLAAIAERHRLSAWAAHQATLWQTRTVCQFIAATLRVAPGQENPLARAADSLGEEPAAAPAASPAGEPASAAEPAPGSYERLNALFGPALIR